MDEKTPPLKLLEDSELPEWVLRQAEVAAPEEDGEQNALGRRRRAAAKTVRNYNEMEQDAEFLKTVLLEGGGGSGDEARVLGRWLGCPRFHFASLLRPLRSESSCFCLFASVSAEKASGFTVRGNARCK